MNSFTSTAMTATSAQRSPFFHAHLQQGQRYNEFGQLHQSWTVHTRQPGGKGDDGMWTYDTRGLPTSSTAAAYKAPSALYNSVRAGPSNFPADQSSIRSSIISPAPSVGKGSKHNTMPADLDQEFWASLADAPTPSPEARHYHYLTRSQSTGGYPAIVPNNQIQHSSSKGALSGSPLRTEVDTREPSSAGDASPTNNSQGVALLPAHRNLSPIDEASFQNSPISHTAHQADTASVHSNASIHSSLFINRPVRRTGSTSTLNSLNSLPPRSATVVGSEPEDHHNQPFAYIPSGTIRSVYPRQVAALPVIPASPRESQNVPHDDADGPISVLKLPPPAAFPGRRQIEHEAFAPLPSATESAEEHARNIQGGLDPIGSVETPSLISASASVRTELTYLTAPDSAGQSRRATTADGKEHARKKSSSRLRDLESGLGPDDLDDPGKQRLKMHAQALKSSLAALLLKAKLRRNRDSTSGIPSGGEIGEVLPDADASNDRRGSIDVASTNVGGKKRLGPVALVAHVAFSGTTKGKPSELLFWAGFIAPWCWLIGGWMLRRDGEAKDGGRGGTDKPLTATEARAERQGEAMRAARVRQKREGGNTVDERNRYTTATNMAVAPSSSTAEEGVEVNESALPVVDEKKGASTKMGLNGFWSSAKSSSAELLDSMRSRSSQDDLEKSGLKPLHLRAGIANAVSPVPQERRIDPWVVRCRVAAVVSGFVLLVLVIVAVVVLVRAF